MNPDTIIGIVFAIVALLSITSIFINLPGFLGTWFGKKHEYKVFWLANQRSIRGIIELLLIPVPEKYHPTGARIIVAIVMGLASYGALFFYNV